MNDTDTRTPLAPHEILAEMRGGNLRTENGPVPFVADIIVHGVHGAHQFAFTADGHLARVPVTADPITGRWFSGGETHASRVGHSEWEAMAGDRDAMLASLRGYAAAQKNWL